MTSANPAIRARIARMGAHALHAKYPAQETTAKARAASLTARDQRLVEANHLDPEAADFEVRLEHARTVERMRFSQAGVKARQAKAASRRKTETK